MGQQKPVPNMEGFCFVDRRARDGFFHDNSYSDLQPESLS